MKVNGMNVATPTECNCLAGHHGKVEFTIKRQYRKNIQLVLFQSHLITVIPYLFMDGAIIADDFYLERHQREKNLFHSVEMVLMQIE